jgi:hypothetical protein
MTEKEEFFSPNHKRLLSIAVWAKYLAWVTLIYFIVRAGLVIFQYQADLQRMYILAGIAGTVDWKDIFRFDPLYYSIDIISDVVSALLQGAIYYVILKSVSLALNMIVETNINYRENTKSGNEH